MTKTQTLAITEKDTDKFVVTLSDKNGVIDNWIENSTVIKRWVKCAQKNNWELLTDPAAYRAINDIVY